MGLACSAFFYGYLFCFCTHLIINRTLILIIIKMFLKRKILSIEPILSAHTRIHTKAPAHTSILTLQSYIYPA